MTITQRILTVTEIYIVFFLEVLLGMMCQDLSWSGRPACEEREMGGRIWRLFCPGRDRESQLEMSTFLDIL
jgi:hypothetical protein